MNIIYRIAYHLLIEVMACFYLLNFGLMLVLTKIIYYLKAKTRYNQNMGAPKG